MRGYRRWILSVPLLAVFGSQTLSLGATVGPVLFGRPGEWIAIARNGEVLATHATFAGMDAIEATVSPDGRVIVFTAWSDAVQNRLMYKWEIGSGQATRLGGAQGFHASPDFTNDGTWVYFAHHPRKGGLPGQHEPGASAQLYRVRIDGSGLEALTREGGCHMHPNVGYGGSVLFAHTDCIMGRSIKVLGHGRRSSGPLEPAFGEYDAAVFDFSEQKIAFAMATRKDVVVFERRVSNGETKELFRIPKPGSYMRLAYSSSGEMMYQDAAGVLIVKRSGDHVRLVNFRVNGQR
jgi:hypothetical protein